MIELVVSPISPRKAKQIAEEQLSVLLDFANTIMDAEHSINCGALDPYLAQFRGDLLHWGSGNKEDLEKFIEACSRFLCAKRNEHVTSFKSSDSARDFIISPTLLHAWHKGLQFQCVNRYRKLYAAARLPVS